MKTEKRKVGRPKVPKDKQGKMKWIRGSRMASFLKWLGVDDEVFMKWVEKQTKEKNNG